MSTGTIGPNGVHYVFVNTTPNTRLLVTVTVAAPQGGAPKIGVFPLTPQPDMSDKKFQGASNNDGQGLSGAFEVGAGLAVWVANPRDPQHPDAVAHWDVLSAVPSAGRERD